MCLCFCSGTEAEMLVSSLQHIVCVSMCILLLTCALGCACGVSVCTCLFAYNVCVCVVSIHAILASSYIAALEM